MKDSFNDTEFYQKIKSGELKIITAEITTIDRYFTKNMFPVLVINDDQKVVSYIHKFSKEHIELSDKKVHVNLITNEAYIYEKET